MPIQPQPEPADFFEKVQKPGEAFLTATPQPKEKDWKHNDHWTKALKDLYKAYGGICAYSCMLLQPGTSSYEVDHFKPKSKYPNEAYRWTNFRLACSRANHNKGTSEEVLDPFTLQPGWFVLDFETYKINPGKHLSPAEARQVLVTVEKLRLNDEATFLQERQNWIEEYTRTRDFRHLQKHAPFIASELQRQKLVGKIRQR